MRLAISIEEDRIRVDSAGSRCGDFGRCLVGSLSLLADDTFKESVAKHKSGLPLA